MQMLRQPSITGHTALIALVILTAHTGLVRASVFATLYSFKGGTDGASPHSGVVLDKNGALYGTTYGVRVFIIS